MWSAPASTEAEVARDEAASNAFHFIDAYDLRSDHTPRTDGIARRSAKGFWAKQHGLDPEVLDRCEDQCDDMDNCSMFCPGRDPWEMVAYLEYPPRDPAAPETILRHVVESWIGMWGNNRPLHKYVVRGEVGGKLVERDFDFNLEGMAHYGLLPDWAQDESNVGLKGRLGPLFLGAEDFIEMWEKAERRAADLSGRASSEFRKPRGP
jgi:hypothetical protein